MNRGANKLTQRLPKRYDMEKLLIPTGVELPKETAKKIGDFLKYFEAYEILNGGTLQLYFDEKSGAFYLICHLTGNVLAQSCDLEARLDGEDEDEGYKLNREITEDQSAYKAMEKDASEGRSFEDIVLEYDTSYAAKKPLKVYGGQHRIRAISKSTEEKGNTVHGVRVYFKLTREQKVEIATVNNTAIAVPNDILDRMREQLLGVELREWGQRAGLLAEGEDFADRRNPDVPTVRLVRTLIVNFIRGKTSNTDDFHQPILCKSGGMDEEYLKIRGEIDWFNDDLLTMGKEFSRLHKIQRERVLNRSNDKNAEFARKALSLSVVASWAYAVGLFQTEQECLMKLFSLPDNVDAPEDPLNAKALSLARMPGIDKDTYRGLGTRSSSTELGRMLEVFIVLARRNSKKITKALANAAIQSYEAKRATYEADKVLGKI